MKIQIKKEGVIMYNVAAYYRLSNDDGDKIESDSISSQRSIVTKFIDANIEYNSITEYCDDGFTGTNFNRPDFKRMIRDIEKEKINLVIVKDLSRFGRDYIDTGKYLEQYFPLRDIRFIAVNDNYDSQNASSNDQFIMPIKNIFNAHYSKDISKKVKSSMRSMQKDGLFIGAFASYGYIKDPNDKHKIIIDEEAATVVKRIFKLFLEGKGKVSIAKMLNEEKIPCPSVYKQLKGMKYTNGQRNELTKYWTYSTIQRILANEMYIGNMVVNKNIRKTVRGKAYKNDPQNWIRKEGTHEAIIDISTWEATQELLKKTTRQVDLNANIGLFAGYIFCGNCQRAMSKNCDARYKGKDKYTYYICGTYKRYGKNMCHRNGVTLETLKKLVLDKLNEQIAKVDGLQHPTIETKKTKQIDIQKLKISLEKVEKRKKELYEDYKDGIISRKEYFQFKEDYSKEEELLSGQLNFLVSNQNEEDKELSKWVDTLIKYKHIEELDRRIIAEILDKIIVSHMDDGRTKIEIIFKFSLK